MIVTDLVALRKKSESCSIEEAKDILVKLHEEIKLHPNAIGLSAVQIGIPKRVAIYKSGPVFHDLVNPEIIDKYDTFLNSEGCLSFPDQSFLIQRCKYVILRDAQAENKFIYQSPESIIIQHEVDHLDGIPCIDKQVTVVSAKYGRNDLCPECGKKLKKCPHGEKYLTSQIRELKQ